MPVATADQNGAQTVEGADLAAVVASGPRFRLGEK